MIKTITLKKNTTKLITTTLFAFALLIGGFFISHAYVFAEDTSVTTKAATDITESDATLNATNGDKDAIGHSFWVSSTPGIDTASPFIPEGVYSTPDYLDITASTDFSAQLSVVTTDGITFGQGAGNMPAITPDTTYYYVAWSNLGGTWSPGQELSVRTSAVVPEEPSTPSAPDKSTFLFTDSMDTPTEADTLTCDGTWDKPLLHMPNNEQYHGKPFVWTHWENDPTLVYGITTYGLDGKVMHNSSPIKPHFYRFYDFGSQGDGEYTMTVYGKDKNGVLSEKTTCKLNYKSTPSAPDKSTFLFTDSMDTPTEADTLTCDGTWDKPLLHMPNNEQYHGKPFVWTHWENDPTLVYGITTYGLDGKVMHNSSPIKPHFYRFYDFGSQGDGEYTMTVYGKDKNGVLSEKTTCKLNYVEPSEGVPENKLVGYTSGEKTVDDAPVEKSDLDDTTPTTDNTRGGGSSGFISQAQSLIAQTPKPTTKTVTTIGEVLGAETYHFVREISKGSIGRDVLELQKYLKNNGYTPGWIDGVFGFQTKAAVIKFQADHKIYSDGLVGPQTLKVLNS
jgi:hypothetical protein